MASIIKMVETFYFGDSAKLEHFANESFISFAPTALAYSCRQEANKVDHCREDIAQIVQR